MSGNERSTKQLIAVTDCRDLVRPAAAAQRLPSGDLDTSLVSGHERGRRAAAFASGGVLVVGAVAALHNLYRSGDDAAELIAWSGLLLLALTALGGGIKLAMWGVRPVITALFDRAKERLAEPVLAVVASGAVIVGALGMWWTFRGGYAGWWQQVSGEHRWTLLLGVGQMLVAVAAGAALFTGGRYVTGLAREALTESGLLIERDRAAGRRRAPEGLWHPGLVAALVGGGLALVVMTAWLTPKVGPTIVGANTLAAVAAIVAVLVWGVGANLGWWKGLAGLWKWATDASHKVAATSGVVALLMFSAGGLGLGWFTPATVPQAHAQCPPDCGGGSNGSGSYGPDASQFQPPQMPSQMPDYQGGINQPPLDQNNGVSIYNTQAPSVSNNGVQGSSGQQGPQQSWDQPAHGTQIPDYQNATPYTQGPGRPNPDFNPGSDAGSQGGQPNQGAQQPVQQPQQASQQPPQQDAGQQPNQSPNQSSDQQKIDDLTRQLQDQQQLSSQDRQRIDDLSKQLQQQGQQRQNGNQKLPKAPSKDKKQDDKNKQDRDDQSGDNDLSALLMGAASTRRRKQDEQDLSDQQQPQGPDTQALAQDGAQLGQSLPGDIANTVSDSVNLGQSAGSAAQNFGSAAQAGASLASSAQSGAVNPMDAVALVQGVSGGISDTADAVGSGASIASTWLNNAGQGARLAADANPQLKAEAEQVQQLTQAGGQVADLTGQVAGGVSQVSGVVNTVSSLGASGMPDTSGATDALSGTATAVNGPGDVPKPPTPPSVPSQSPSSVQALDSTTTRAPQQPPQPSNPSTPKTANQSSTPKPLSPLEASTFPAPLQALNTAQAASTPDPNAGRLSSMPGVRDVSQPPLRPAPTLQPDQVDAFRAITRQNLENQNVPADQIEQRVNDAVKQAQTPRFMPDPQPMRTPGAQPLDRPLGDKFNDVMGRANDRAYDDIDGLGQLGKNLTGQGGPGAPGVAESWKDLGTNTVKGLPDAVGGGFVADGKRLYEEPGNFIGDKMVELPLAAVSVPLGGEGAAIERGVLGDLASTETKAVSRGPVETPPVQLPAVDVPKPRLADYFQPGSPPKASELEKYALSQGWKKSQTSSGPAKYSDNNGIVRMTIKEGSQRAPGSELPHVELRDPNGQRIDPFGNPVARKSPDNHTAIGWDW
ncbi:Uncharacterised protein [Mycobacteroides abscessus subsp. bolletii]|nr:Uncharacterised protein [Mycobacteroides abscessus subsp. bolletii]SIJ64995.1 Uncharacterised protein [Mycobacteroides abscessus subsp. bolletii]SKT28131.1 Uncharacterised protein [Mycobacteroides abscessus subsp. bolletii]SKT31627.1 Uncharacterised protein [Mycobacteroides abscessus subsp. bolletii]SLD62931.1 Uncharacterised protein [Mycobacteroides abscessus subsp. bolletii]